MFLKWNWSLGNKYKAPHAELIPKYKCIYCKTQLHPSDFERSEAYGDYGEVKQKGGCDSSSKAPPPPKKPQQQSKK